MSSKGRDDLLLFLATHGLDMFADLGENVVFRAQIVLQQMFGPLRAVAHMGDFVGPILVGEELRARLLRRLSR